MGSETVMHIEQIAVVKDKQINRRELDGTALK